LGEDRHRLDVCGLKMSKQLVQVRDVEPAASKVGALTRNKTVNDTRGGWQGTRGKLTISRSNVGYKIGSNTSRGSVESRGEGMAQEQGSAKVEEKAKLEQGRTRR
jgi:hypothetical protein